MPKDKLTHCPECGVSLEGRDPRAHALSHWPEKIPPDRKHELAIERQAQLMEAAK